MVRLGISELTLADAAPGIFCDHERLRLHLGRPWGRAWVARRLGACWPASPSGLPGSVGVPEELLARHALVVGATGSGKSRLVEHLASQLAPHSSVVLLDPKGETADRLVARAAALGLPPRRVIVLDPREPAGVPAWNPLLTGVPIARAVADWVHVIEAGSGSWGPRLADLLTNALLVAGSHRLSVAEAAGLLTDDLARERLLARPVRAEDPVAYREALAGLREFGSWGRGERYQAVGPVTNKLREYLRSGYLRPLLCARRNTLDLARLWREPLLLVVRLDRAALGEAGARQLGGLLTHLLFRTALRCPGPLPVTLVLEELPVLERFVGPALEEILAQARSLGLRCVVACQHLGQLGPGLREALLANAAVQAFLRLGHADARLVGQWLALGSEPRLARVVAAPERPDPRASRSPRAEWSHVVRDLAGRPLRLNGEGWGWVERERLFGSDPAEALCQAAAAAGVPRLYVRAADTGEPVELRRYVAGVPEEDYRVEGPILRLVISMPRPRLAGSDLSGEAEAARNWARRLEGLDVRQAVIRLAGGQPQACRIDEVGDPAVPSEGLERFLAASRAAWGGTGEHGVGAGGQDPAGGLDDGGFPGEAADLSVNTDDTEDEEDGSI